MNMRDKSVNCTCVCVTLVLGLIAFSIALGTITDATNKVTSACNGSATAFTFSFPIVETSDLVVIHRVTSTGVETVLTETTHYVVSATNNDYSSGGTVTTVSTYASGITLTLIRNVPESQDADLEDSKVLRLEDLEGAFDRLTMQAQDLEEEIGRCLKYPRTETRGTELSNSIDRADKRLGFDASGNLTVYDEGGAGYIHTDYVDNLIVRQTPHIDVKAYSAVGNGVTDDTAAIQAAIDAAELESSGTVKFPPGDYLTSSPLIMDSQYVTLDGGNFARITFNGAGYAIELKTNFCVIKDIRFSIGTTASGGILLGEAGKNTISNKIHHCNFFGTDRTVANRCAIYVQGVATPSATYFNWISDNTIMNFYDGIVVNSAGNANFYQMNRIERYYRYGIDLGDSDENQIMGGFFQQAAGRSAGDLTYGVNIESGGFYNQGFYGAEPGAYSSAIRFEGTSNFFQLNDNCNYTIQGSAVASNNYISTRGFSRIQRRLTIGDDASYSPLKLTARSVAPTIPTAGNIYLDDGSNTGTGKSSFRYYGTAWENLGSNLFTDTITLTNVNIKALVGTPKELIAAQGAGTLIEFVSAVLTLNYGTEVLAEPTAPDDLAIEYDDGTGQQIITWDTTGFIENNADCMEIVNAASVGGGAAAITTAANVNKNIVLINTGGNYTGNATADTTMQVIITYRVHTSLGL